jgi:hydroxyacylglutathione hydrolase
MYFEHVYERGLAQSSYVVGCQATGDAIVIDPKRDIDTYLEIVDREGLRITHVTETHIHADFLSGAREIAAATGAKLLLSDEGGPEWQYRFPHIALHGGDTIKVGNIELEVIHTPGHTPEHISFLLYDRATGDEPRMVFTGDFIFVGDVGRPDLLDEAAGMTGTREPGARLLFQSLKSFDSLPGFVQVWPGHGAGSACGKSLGAVPSTTIGYERATSWAFLSKDERSFVGDLLDGQPEPPYYFAQMKQLNRSRPGDSVIVSLPAVTELDVATVRSRMEAGDIQVVDLRDSESFFTGHIAGSYNVPFDRSMVTWFGWILDYESPIVLVADRAQIDAAQRALIRIGLDRLEGYLDASVVGKIPSSGTITSIDVARARELRDSGARIVDVRGAGEFRTGHIDEAINVHAGRVKRELESIPRDREIVVHCATGYRSAIAASVLGAAGYPRVYNMRGGFDAWEREIGLDIVGHGA